MAPRRKGREAALQMLYQMDVSGVSAEGAIKAYWGHLAATPDADAFADSLVRAYANVQADVDELIRRVSHHWRIERMSLVDRNILRVAATELLVMTDIPRRVTLNEAVELAKRYGADGSSGFVNGVLDQIANTLSRTDT